jgi:hypothetical protein
MPPHFVQCVHLVKVHCYSFPVGPRGDEASVVKLLLALGAVGETLWWQVPWPLFSATLQTFDGPAGREESVCSAAGSATAQSANIAFSIKALVFPRHTPRKPLVPVPQHHDRQQVTKDNSQLVLVRTVLL